MIKELGFAAYLIIRGYNLVGYKNGCFIFNLGEDEEKRRVEWVNSEFAKFDKTLLDLKNFRK